MLYEQICIVTTILQHVQQKKKRIIFVGLLHLLVSEAIFHILGYTDGHKFHMHLLYYIVI